MKAYISGKITGIDKIEVHNNFQKLEQKYKSRFVIVNPLNIHKRRKSWIGYIIKDLWELAFCQVVIFDINWQDSKGARIERFFAKLFKKRIIYENKSNPTNTFAD